MSFENIILTVGGSTIVILLGIIGYFLKRQDQRQEKVNERQEKTNGRLEGAIDRLSDGITGFNAIALKWQERHDALEKRYDEHLTGRHDKTEKRYEDHLKELHKTN